MLKKLDPAGLIMGDDVSRKAGGSKHFVSLSKDGKFICRTQCLNPPCEAPWCWSLEIVARKKIHPLNGLPQCSLHPVPENSRDQSEWVRFSGFLQRHNMVAIAKFDSYKFYILPPDEGSNLSHVRVAYQMKKVCGANDGQMECEPVVDTSMRTRESSQLISPGACTNGGQTSPFQMNEVFAAREPATSEDDCSSVGKLPQSKEKHNAQESREETCRGPSPHVAKQKGLEKNYARADPSYLKTLGQTHSGWIFGAIAELVDNSRDAKASRLDISIEIIYSKKAGKDIPVLSVIDNGHGMTHKEVVRLTCFGHKQPDADDPDHIGRFGVGFKTGAMRIGRDALVLTQTADSRSIAFLSQSLNGGKDNLEIPIVSYHRKGQFMEVDTSVQSETLAKYNLKAIKEFSPFNKYLIGEKAGLFHEHTGTQIYIWNLDEWGSDYCLEWCNGLSGGSSFHQGDILIRSKRIRSRPGQMSQKVPLDYSLRSYLEVIFLDPRMKIYVQGSMVKSRPLAKSLNNTVSKTGNIMEKHVQLTLGRSQLEWEHANCGMFLYWHGRLIEAYKRVGVMVHNGDMGRGVIGVMDVTDLMDNGNGGVWVHSNKQGFQDCEPYAALEEWLGCKVNEYCDKNCDKLQLKKGNSLYKPDHDWVQCDKCRKWRMLNSSLESKNLPLQWFCYMEPFNGSCEIEEQKVEPGVITVSEKRSGYDKKDVHGKKRCIIMRRCVFH